mmetsp:Transcript_72191/g.205170  ORF Transcript_72191/g.205170 Transcript_72191/m.205170 type:complete len:244 (-) Transcript_72191:319-1050(-)
MTDLATQGNYTTRTDLSRTGGIRSCAFVMHRAAGQGPALSLCTFTPPPLLRATADGDGRTRHKPNQHIHAQLFPFPCVPFPLTRPRSLRAWHHRLAPSAQPVNTAESPHTERKPRDVVTQPVDPGARHNTSNGVVPRPPHEPGTQLPSTQAPIRWRRPGPSQNRGPSPGRGISKESPAGQVPTTSRCHAAPPHRRATAPLGRQAARPPRYRVAAPPVRCAARPLCCCAAAPLRPVVHSRIRRT